MIIRHTVEQVKDYYERAGINQSSLKVILESGMQRFIADAQDLLMEKEKRHFIIGNAVDVYLTMGESVFNSMFHISRIPRKPGPKAMAILKDTFTDVVSRYSSDEVSLIPNEYSDIILHHCTIHEYYPKWKAETRVESILKGAGIEYWADLVKAVGKQILSEDESAISLAIINSILTHRNTARLFKETDHVDIIFQLPMYFKYDDIDCKALMDMVRIDHVQQRIFPIDIKTTGDYILRFNRQINARRYDIQGSFYMEGLSKHLKQISMLIKKDITKYGIANLAFIADSTINPGLPFIFPLSDELVKDGRLGNIEEGTRGWIQAINIYRPWLQNQFNIDLVTSDVNGILVVGKNYEYESKSILL